MAQIDIDLGTGAGNNDGDLVYTAFQTAQANFDDLYNSVDGLGNIRYFRRDIDLNGVSGDTEWEKVANAINATNGFTCPLSYRPLFRYIQPYTPVRTDKPTEPPYYNVYYYTLVSGTGYYGTGTPPSGVTQLTATPGQVVPLGDRTEQAQTDVNTLGEIGATAIQTAVNASATEIVVSGLTVIRVTRSGVLYEYQFTGEEGSYGVSWSSTSASNFIDIYNNGDLSRNINPEAKAPNEETADFNISSTHFGKTTEVTHNNAIVTIQADVSLTTAFLPGSMGRLNFSGTGTHTINYPSTDGVSSLSCVQGDLVYFEKRASDEWVVKKYGESNVNYTGYEAFVSSTETKSTSGSLVIGKTYNIQTLESGDDFSNVGYVSAGTDFVATGTTPTTWTNSTTVYNITDSTPTVDELKNNLGQTATWTYDPSTESFLCTFAGAVLTANKTVLLEGNTDTNNLSRTSTTVLTSSNDLNQFIEVRVYN